MMRVDLSLLESLHGKERRREYNKLYAYLYRRTDEGHEAQRVSGFKYAQTEAGKRANIEYRQSPKGKAKNVRYDGSPKGKARNTKYYYSSKGGMANTRYKQSLKSEMTQVRYRQSIEGKISQALKGSIRRARSTYPEMLAARVEYMHFMQEFCSVCKCPYIISFQVDHIVALCNGGTDDWNNLQPLCIECHREKTKSDLRIYRDRIGG